MAWARSILHLGNDITIPREDERLADAENALAVQRRKLEATQRTAAGAHARADELARAVDRALREMR